MIEKRLPLPYILFAQIMISSGILFSFLQPSLYAGAEAVLNNGKPSTYSQHSVPYHLLRNTGYLNSDVHFRQKTPMHLKTSFMYADNVFQIEPSDAIDNIKYSPPDITYDLFNKNSGMKVPSPYSNHKIIQTSAQDSSPSNFQEQTFSNLQSQKENPLKPMRDIRYLNSENGEDMHINAAGGDDNYKLENTAEKNKQTHDMNTTNLYMQAKNNSTNVSDDLLPVSSDAVLNYEVPSISYAETASRNVSAKQTFEIISDVPSHNNLSNSDTELPKTILDYMTENSVTLDSTVNNDFINQSNLTDYTTSPDIFPSIYIEGNATKSLSSMDSEKKLSSGTVAGIVIAVLVTVTLLSSAVIYLLYRRFNGRCTSVVESKFNTDNCGYLDDSLRSSIYLNNHIELPKESSEEMTSLDNDSFLNSLETMTIQNYWADNSKNTKDIPHVGHAHFIRETYPYQISELYEDRLKIEEE